MVAYLPISKRNPQVSMLGVFWPIISSIRHVQQQVKLILELKLICIENNDRISSVL